MIGLENVAATPHIVACKHSSTWETLFLSRFLPPLAYVAKKELLSLPFFGWAFALASPITIDRAAGQNAMVQIVGAGTPALRAGLLDHSLPGGHADSRRQARALQDRRRAPRHRHARADPADRAQRRLAVAEGRDGQAPGHDHDVDRQADRSRCDGCRRELMQAVEAWIEGEVARLGLQPRRRSMRRQRARAG